MAQDSKDLLSKLADRGEQVLGRISDLPGAESLVQGLNGVRERVDEMQKRLLGLDAIERRLAALEGRVDALTKDVKTPTRRAAAKPSSGPQAKEA